MTSSLLWICDPQPRLLNALPTQKQLVANINKLIGICHARYHVSHILITEQVPAKLGHTDASILEAVKAAQLTPHVVSKTRLAGTEAIRELEKELGLAFDTVVCAGAETHICVFKTVPQLLDDCSKAKIVVVSDCVGSISANHHSDAIEIMRAWPRVKVEDVEGATSDRIVSLKPHTIHLTKLIRHGSDTDLIAPARGIAGKVKIAFEAWDVYKTSRVVSNDLKTKVRICFEIPESDVQLQDALLVCINDTGCAEMSRLAEDRNGVSMALELFLFTLLNDAGDPNFKDTLQFVKAAKAL